jgi:rubrerythrin
MRKMTQANLEAAFAGESQAHMKYAIFADKAEEEGYPEVARLFRAISFAERVHATNHLRELGDIGDTVANLGTAMKGENYENTEMYPAFNAVAKLQEEKGAMLSIHYALEAEKIHEAM